MARRKQTYLDDLIGISSKLPWWVGVALAIAAYVGLHGVAIRDVSAAAQPGTLVDFVDPNLFQSLASIGQYGVPLVLLIGAALSVYGRSRRATLSDPTTMGPDRGGLGNMSWQQFEFMVSEAFRRRGYSVAEKGRGGTIGIFDLVLKKHGETYLVHCKQWRAIKVGMGALHELHEAMAARGAKGGFAVTSGVFTDEAQAFAKIRNIELMDGKVLRGMVRKVRQPARVTLRDPLSVLTTGAPFCPECQGRMMKRRSRHGANGGKEFWRCLRHPDCSGRRQA
ncbi:MAG: restriction endonuclease [Thiobacillus sp.]|nr:restriction endonuclease [Thiobacillus sp.]